MPTQEGATAAARELGNYIYSNSPMKPDCRFRYVITRQELANGNKIEHRLFSFISLTWKCQPLLNYETVVNLISATKTRSGLKVKAVLDKTHYETGVPVTKAQMEELHLSREKTNPQWNYTLSPRLGMSTLTSE